MRIFRAEVDETKKCGGLADGTHSGAQILLSHLFRPQQSPHSIVFRRLMNSLIITLLKLRVRGTESTPQCAYRMPSGAEGPSRHVLASAYSCLCVDVSTPAGFEANQYMIEYFSNLNKLT